MTLDMISIGERIKNRRKELHLTQNDIKNTCGISSGSMSEIERGIRTPSIVIFHLLSQILDCSMDWLATGISPNAEHSSISEYRISDDDENFLKNFHQLTPDDQDEILLLLDLKLRKMRRLKDSKAKSSQSMTIDSRNMVG